MCPNFTKDQINNPNKVLCMCVGPYFDKDSGKAKPIEDKYTSIYSFPEDCIGFNLHIGPEKEGERGCLLTMYFICHNSKLIPPETYEYVISIPFDTAKELWLA